MDWASRSCRTIKILLEESQTMDTQLVRTADMIGAITANIYFVLIISVFSMVAQNNVKCNDVKKLSEVMGRASSRFLDPVP
jgi:hypothetical protein